MEHRVSRDGGRRLVEEDTNSDNEILIDHDGYTSNPQGCSSREMRIQRRTALKPSSEDIHDEILRDSGVDTTGMSKQEKSQIVKVLMQSKEETTPIKENSATCKEEPSTENVDIDENCSGEVKMQQEMKESDKQKPRKQESGSKCARVTKPEQTTAVKFTAGQQAKKCKRRQIKRPIVQAKDVSAERPKKQRKIEQYSQIIIDNDDDDSSNSPPGIQDDKVKVGGVEGQRSQGKSASKLVAAVMEDDETQQHSVSPDIFQMDSSDEREKIEVNCFPETTEEETQDYDTEEKDMGGQKTTSYEESCPELVRDQHLLAGCTPPARLTRKIISSGDKTTVKVSSGNTTGMCSDSRRMEEKRVPFSLKLLKDKVLDTASVVKRKLSHISPLKISEGTAKVPKEPSTRQMKLLSSKGEGDSKEVYVPPLKRHYRKARKVRMKYPYYAPDMSQIPSYTKVILQLMEIYSRKLTEAQLKVQQMVDWGEPVRCGRHMEMTMDFVPTNRSKGNLYKELSSDEDDFVPYRPRSESRNKSINPKRNKSKLDPECGQDLGKKDAEDVFDGDTQPFEEEFYSASENPGKSDKDEFVSYKPRSEPSRRSINLKSSLDPKSAGVISDRDSKDVFDLETQPFDDNFYLASEKPEIVDLDVPEEKFAEGQSELPGNVRSKDVDSDDIAGSSTDRWLSAKKQPVLQRQANNEDSSGQKKTAKELTTNYSARPRREVKAPRRTMYTEIPDNPGAVKTKEQVHAFDSEDSSSEQELTLQKSGATYSGRKSKSRRDTKTPSLQRLGSGDSLCSIETIGSDDDNVEVKQKRKINSKSKTSKNSVKSPSPFGSNPQPSSPNVPSESFLDGSSQKSAFMINAQGELYSTQMCLLQERSKEINKKLSGKKKHNNPDMEEQEVDEVLNTRNRTKGCKKPQKKSSYDIIIDSQKDNNSDCDSVSMSDTQAFRHKTSPLSDDDNSGELLILREGQTLVDDGVDFTLTNSPKYSDQSNVGTNTVDSQSPGFKKRGGTKNKKLKVVQIDSDEEVSSDISERRGNLIKSLHSQEPELQTEQTYTRVNEVKCQPQEDRNVTEAEMGQKRRRQYQYVERVQKKMKQEPIVLVPCPLCGVSFPRDQIEGHASECDGEVVNTFPTSANLNDSARFEVEDFHVGNRLPKSPDEEAAMFGRKQETDIPQDKSPPSRQYAKVKDVEEEVTIREQMMPCYICDEEYPTGEEYNKHIDECLNEATRRQAEADLRGYQTKRTEPAFQGTRTTRLKTKEEQKSKLLKRLDEEGDITEGYSSETEDESYTLQSLLRRKTGKTNVSSVSLTQPDSNEAETSSSYGDTDSSSEDEQLPNCKNSQVDKPVRTAKNSSTLPGGWSLEELTNSPLKTYVPINAQENPEGFINQFDYARRRYENRAQTKPRTKRKRRTKRRRGKKKKPSAKKPAAKKRKTDNIPIVHIS